MVKASILHAHWDMAQGRHPYYALDDSKLYSLPPFASGQLVAQVNALNLPVRYGVSGHNLMHDHTMAALCQTVQDVPISPLFVRDLAGRVIYTGTGPEFKAINQWPGENYFGITFPKNCTVVAENNPVYGQLENVFFVHYRALEVSSHKVTDARGQERLGILGATNLHPYKARVDSFYGDGWRLPQTELLFVHTEVDPQLARDAAEDLMARWGSRPQGQGYEDFYEAQGAEAWFSALFEAGCTVIPTFEAHNGYNQVDEDFTLLDYWPGRAVAGLHEVVEQRADNSPEGTILQVLVPGFITAEHIQPAKVVVSDGSGYTSPLEPYPKQFPNLLLPHPRTAPDWGSTWLPVAPIHFEAPAIWGWHERTGRFMQLAGPLWDPVHYFYGSLSYIRENISAGQTGVPVPEDMKNRFFPASPLKDVDIHDPDASPEKQVRMYAVETDGIIADIGYHPMPPQFEYELDVWWFPDLLPENLVNEMPPPEMQDFIIPVAQSNLDPDSAYQFSERRDDKPWINSLKQFVASAEVAKDYPYIMRYVPLTEEEVKIPLDAYFLPRIEESELLSTAQQKCQSAEHAEQVDQLAPGLFDELFEYDEAALSLRAARVLIYQEQPEGYAAANWRGIYPFLQISARVQNEPVTQEDPQNVEQPLNNKNKANPLLPEAAYAKPPEI